MAALEAHDMKTDWLQSMWFVAPSAGKQAECQTHTGLMVFQFVYIQSIILMFVFFRNKALASKTAHVGESNKSNKSYYSIK